MNNLTLRILSALVLAPVVLGAVYAGGLWFFGLITLAATLMVIEWHRLCRIANIYSLFVTLFFTHACLLVMKQHELTLSIMLLGIGVLGVLSQHITRKDGRWWAVLGFLYVVIPCMALLFIRNTPRPEGGDSALLLFWLLAVVWATDIGAYIAGKTIGGPKIAPGISPKKTWAGLIGGIVTAIAVVLLPILLDRAGLYSFGTVDRVVFALILPTICISVVSQAGDFFESRVKRRFDAKDSGTLIPGHGGILDRVDGLLFAAPVFAGGMMIMEFWHVVF